MRNVLVASDPAPSVPTIVGDMQAVLAAGGVRMSLCQSTSQTIRRVEQGGLDGAVLIADRWHIDALPLMRIIRTLDSQLPCWLVTDEMSRRLLQAAFDLRVRGVLAAPLEAVNLLRELHRALGGWVME